MYVYASAGSGDPAVPTTPMLLRSNSRPGCRPALRQATTKAGLRPIIVGGVSSASRHWNDTSGHTGSPSIITIDARVSSAETSAFHIIQAVVENHISRPPGLLSQPSDWVLKCSTSMPPCPWTIALGSPVVPEENSTYSGWSNATEAYSSGPRSAISVSQPCASGSVYGPYGTCTTCSSVGRPARAAAASARRSSGASRYL